MWGLLIRVYFELNENQTLNIQQMFRHYILGSQKQIFVNLRQTTHITQTKNRIVFSLASSQQTNGTLILGSGGSESSPTEIHFNFSSQEEAKQEIEKIKDSLQVLGQIL